ncbi:hypothetical protein CWR43_14155 [Rhizobium sullae]|uniref:NACHT domain-containing protein n=1 Tax=Rhizobium sullae TaxID=50338 RepID=A0A2N0DAS6_RHISU|nr:hypothetical protein CWR43_14155 [Rhizobium sullae]
MLGLNPSGPTGFEGLVAVLLSGLLGQPFRLASSGSQRGRDGDSAFDRGEIYFEAKRYSETIKPADVKSKFVDLLNDRASQLDMWVLAATCEIGAQLANDVQAAATNVGIYAPILDWPETALGKLPVAIACSNTKAKEFLEQNLHPEKRHLLSPALAAIDYFAAHGELPELGRSLRSYLSSSENGYRHAKLRNHEWMKAALSSKIRARAAFAQVLTPLDLSGHRPLSRSAQVQLSRAFSGRPAKDLYAVIGNEGVGKSWLAVQSWLACDQPSILLIVNSSDVPSIDALQDFDSFLVDRLVLQSVGAAGDERQRSFWKRRLRGWRENPDPENVRLTVILDGLNETGKSDWARIVDHTAHELKQLGGCLVVTTRQVHWPTVSRSLFSSFAQVPVDIWTVEELATLLGECRIDIQDVAHEVQQSLRNPRILGIALGLRDGNQIELFRDLSVGRLMFEHMRQARNTGAAPISGEDFANLLRSIAQQVLQRAQHQLRDDLQVFSVREVEDLQAVASCRFFDPVPTNHTLYTIKSEGLDLALAIWLIDRLEAEHRNGRDPADELLRILEPVAALDETALMLALATQVACVNLDVQPSVRSALVGHFVSLQNVTHDGERVFAALARHAPDAFVAAAERAYTADFHPRRVDELLQALLDYRDHPRVTEVVTQAIQRWLSFISLAPERMMHRTTATDAAAEVDAERQRRREIIERKVAGLTRFERDFIAENLISVQRYRYGRLQEAAFYLAAGRPLAGLASTFTRWAFADALSPSFDAPDKSFRHLLRFNTIDWSETRTSILAEVERLTDETTTEVGKWAKVELLRATGDGSDAGIAHEMAEWLTRDREKFEGWSLLKKYCPVDPCDPVSVKPIEIEDTSTRYAALDTAALHTHMGQSSDDGFFNMARTGVARFSTEIAQSVHRSFADDVLGRQGFARRQGVIGILPHSAVLTRQQAERFLERGQHETAGVPDDPNERDAWLTAQYSLFAAIGHFTADEQLEAISRVRGGTVLLDVLGALRIPSAEKAEEILERVAAADDETAQSMVLGALQYTRPQLTERARAIVGQMVSANNAISRAYALGLVAHRGDAQLLKQVAEGKWSANVLEGTIGGYERWFGSTAILAAAKANLLSVSDALNRIDLGHYGFAATVSQEMAREVAARIDVALGNSLRFTVTGEPPELTVTTSELTDAKPPMFSVSAREDKSDDLLSFLGSGSSGTFDERQKRASDAFDEFVKRVGDADARLIIAELTVEGVEAIAAAAPDKAAAWLDEFAKTEKRQLQNIHHFAVLLAIVLAARGSPIAAALIPSTLGLEPTFKKIEGHGRLPSLAAALWKHAYQSLISDICEKRLKNLWTDAEISDEVALAFKYGRRKTVFSVMDDLAGTGHPAHICRAITIAGFCDVDPRAQSVLDQFADYEGFVRSAHQASHEAYKRNEWARNWYQVMRKADTAVSFWEASIQFLKIVDVRFDAWIEADDSASSSFTSFFPSVTQELKNRISKFRTKRKKLLFGQSIPPDEFVLPVI